MNDFELIAKSPHLQIRVHSGIGIHRGKIPHCSTWSLCLTNDDS